MLFSYKDKNISKFPKNGIDEKVAFTYLSVSVNLFKGKIETILIEIVYLVQSV